MHSRNPDCSAFATALLRFIARSLKQSDGILSEEETLGIVTTFNSTVEEEESKETDGTMNPIETDQHWYPVTDSRFFMAITSLKLLTNMDGLVDEVLCQKGNPAIILSLLELPLETEVRYKNNIRVLSLDQVFFHS